MSCCSIFSFFLPFPEFPLPPPPYTCLVLPAPLAPHKSYLGTALLKTFWEADYLPVPETRQQHLNLPCVRLSPTVVIHTLSSGIKENTLRNLQQNIRTIALQMNVFFGPAGSFSSTMTFLLSAVRHYHLTWWRRSWQRSKIIVWIPPEGIYPVSNNFSTHSYTASIRRSSLGRWQLRDDIDSQNWAQERRNTKMVLAGVL